ncbi:hypothetical protein WICMUC_004429 [Wickerhamomyces mucosus]|uniref:Vps41 beta-propeller domain-containing protein n=1 Tax=Wickerhamomyces mucosus TaxID=1378264 RepID=A0A9P8TBA9_9ASCO|nr:hypothetical protein WICMUC_004429 [Wickerhamomyces mucosus]
MDEEDVIPIIQTDEAIALNSGGEANKSEVKEEPTHLDNNQLQQTKIDKELNTEQVSNSISYDGSDYDEFLDVHKGRPAHGVGDSEKEFSNDEDESDEDESDEDEDYEYNEEDEEEEPPLLKYSRLQQLPKTFFNKELVSSSLVTDHLVAFGTSSGLLYVTDAKLNHLGTLRARKSPILSIHTDGQYIIAASMDGTIIISLISNINVASNTLAYDLKIPLFSVVFNGTYKQTKSFIYGTKSGSIISSTINWLNNRQDKIIWQSPTRSPIVKLEIVRNILVWLNDDGIGFIDISSEKVIKLIRRPENSPNAELVWPKVNFIDYNRIVIGWVNYIWSINIEESNSNSQGNTHTMVNGHNSNGGAFKFSSAMSSFSKPSNELNVTIDYHFKIENDAFIGGVGSFKDDSIILLILKQENGKLVAAPELRIVNYFTKEEISSDEIVLKDYQNLKINDFQLGQCGDSKFYLICSTDGIIADEYTLKDRYDWYISREMFLQAYDISQYVISKRERANVGIRQVECYIKNDGDNWKQATTFLKTVIDDSFSLENDQVYKDLWDQWSWIYIKNKKIIELASILPYEEKTLLSKSVYNTVLEYFLTIKDQKHFHKYLNLWDLSIFSNEEIFRKVEDLLEVEPQLNIFRRCLAESYLKLDEPKLAIKHFIALKDSLVINLLAKYHLVSEFADFLPSIIKFKVSEEEVTKSSIEKLGENISEITDILVGNRHEISPNRIIKLMDDSNLQVITFLYLKKLYQIDPLLMESYETTMCFLYTKYEPAGLLSFLKKNWHYDIDEVIDLIREKKLYKELVFLLGKVGKNREAMFLIIQEMNDPEEAIDFATEQRSPELWDIFLEYGIKKPNFIKVLIQYTGILFDTSVLKNIPKGVQIEGLKESLIRITNENHCNLIIQSSILRIFAEEGVEYCDLMNELRLKGQSVDKFELFKNFDSVQINQNGELLGIGNYF